MSKVNYEIEIKVTGFVQLDLPEDLSIEEIEEYIAENETPEDLLHELQNGEFATETVTEMEVLQTSGYLDEAGFTDE